MDSSTVGEALIYGIAILMALAAGGVCLYLITLLMRIGEGIESIENRLDSIERHLSGWRHS